MIQPRGTGFLPGSNAGCPVETGQHPNSRSVPRARPGPAIDHPGAGVRALRDDDASMTAAAQQRQVPEERNIWRRRACSAAHRAESRTRENSVEQ